MLLQQLARTAALGAVRACMARRVEGVCVMGVGWWKWIKARATMSCGRLLLNFRSVSQLFPTSAPPEFVSFLGGCDSYFSLVSHINLRLWLVWDIYFFLPHTVHPTRTPSRKLLFLLIAIHKKNPYQSNNKRVVSVWFVTTNLIGPKSPRQKTEWPTSEIRVDLDEFLIWIKPPVIFLPQTSGRWPGRLRPIWNRGKKIENTY